MQNAQAITLEEAVPGAWLVNFPDADLVNALFCSHLIAPLVEASKTQPIVLLADLPNEVKLVHPNMVPFWLDAFSKRGLAVRAIGVVTPHRGVKIVLNGVQLALRILNREIAVATKPTRAELIDWAKTQ